MKSLLRSFNIYLCAWTVVLATGCHSGGFDLHKEYTSLQVFLEVRNGAKNGAQMVEIGTTPVYVDSTSFLPDADEQVSGATLVDYPDGTYAVQVSFNEEGTILLENMTMANKGQNVIIHLLFPPSGKQPPKSEDQPASENAAPGQPRSSCWVMARNRSGISGGAIVFTPDGSHAEAERIVRGFKNLVSERNKLEP